MSIEAEATFLAPLFNKAARGGILVVSEIKQALDERLGRTTALASTYNLLHRHNWRKLAPDKRCPKRRRSLKKLPELITSINETRSGANKQAPLRVMFQDEARFGRISDTRRCWCPRPVRPLTMAMVTQEYTYACAAVSVSDGALDTLILLHVNSGCMQLFLDEVAPRYQDE